MTARQHADRITQLALEKKGKDITLMDLQGLSDVADFFVVVSGESDVHVKTIGGHIENELAREGIKVWKREGYQHLRWVLLDYVEVVVHIFRPESRTYYDIERLWADAKTTLVKDDAENRILSSNTD